MVEAHIHLLCITIQTSGLILCFGPGFDQMKTQMEIIECHILPFCHGLMSEKLPLTGASRAHNVSSETVPKASYDVE